MNNLTLRSYWSTHGSSWDSIAFGTLGGGTNLDAEFYGLTAISIWNPANFSTTPISNQVDAINIGQSGGSQPSPSGWMKFLAGGTMIAMNGIGSNTQCISFEKYTTNFLVQLNGQNLVFSTTNSGTGTPVAIRNLGVSNIVQGWWIENYTNVIGPTNVTMGQGTSL